MDRKDKVKEEELKRKYRYLKQKYKVTFSFKEFKEKMLEKGYEEMYEYWIAQGCQRDLTPTICKIDQNKEYEIENIEIDSRRNTQKKLIHKWSQKGSK
ncbi:hypothetical protein [Wolinella succinogenes]|uniref:hypothetical protein n=1 Tax=Wolinella succinogenes TaxID=844 RepID=UPI002FCACDF4